MSDHDAAGAAREESARMGVQILAMIAAIPVGVWLERKAGDPDAARELRMRACRAAERACARAAGVCWRLAERARLGYERDRA